MRALLYLCIIAFNIFNLNAQLKGKVIDGEKKKLLPGVNIYLQHNRIAIGITNQQGEFEIAFSNRISSNDTIVFSHIGYHTLKYTLSELNQLHNQVVMHEHTQLLNEITVEGRHNSSFLGISLLATLPKPVYSFGGFLLNDEIYVVAGDETLVKKLPIGTEAWEYRSNDMLIYNINNNQTNTKKLNIKPRAGHAAHFYKNKIFILGGKRYSTNRKIDYTDATMEIYDMDKDTLYIDPVNPHQAVDFTSFIYNDNLYVMGGAINEKVFSNRIHTLDLKRGIWYEMKDTIPATWCGKMNGILVGNTVYFFGGYRTVPRWTAKSYNIITGDWKDLCDLKDGVSYPGLASDGNKVYIYENKTLQVYNIVEDTIIIYQLNLNLENAGLFYSNRKLYIIGGCVCNGIYVTPSAAIYSIDLKQIYPE